MDIEGILEILARISVGADMRRVARQASLLKLAANIGIADIDEVSDDINDCELILSETSRNNIEHFISLDREGGSPWIEYKKSSDEDAIELIKGHVTELYRDSIPAELCLIKKSYGIPVMAMYNRGNLISLNVRYVGSTGRDIDIENKAVKGLPKYTGFSNSDLVKVYGTLGLDSDAVTTETSVATELAARVIDENLEGLIFRAELLENVPGKISDTLEWANSVGFEISDYRVEECDIYNVGEYFGEKIFELFSFNEDEYIDGILVMLNDIELLNINNIKNNIIVKLRDVVEKTKYMTTAKGIRLEQKNSGISLVLEVEPFNINSDESVSELPVSVDDAYNIELGDKLTVYKRGNKFVIERGHGDE